MSRTSSSTSTTGLSRPAAPDPAAGEWDRFAEGGQIAYGREIFRFCLNRAILAREIPLAFNALGAKFPMKTSREFYSPGREFFSASREI